VKCKGKFNHFWEKPCPDEEHKDGQGYCEYHAKRKGLLLRNVTRWFVINNEPCKVDGYYYNNILTDTSGREYENTYETFKKALEKITNHKNEIKELEGKQNKMENMLYNM